VDGIGFSSGQREDTVTKNVLQKLSKRIATEFKPQNLRLSLAEQSEGGVVNDRYGVLSTGVSGTVVRKAGRVPGIPSDVWAPVGSYKVYGVEGSEALLQAQGPVSPKIKRGDIFVFDSGALPTQSRQSFTSWFGPVQSDQNSRDLSNYPVTKGIGFALFARNLSAPVYVNDMPEIALDRLNQFSNLQYHGVTKSRSIDYCVNAVLRTSNISIVSKKGGFVDHKQLITMGFTLFRAGERVGANGLRAEVISGPFQTNTSPRQIEIYTERDALNQFSEAAAAAVKAIQIPQ